MQQSQTFCSEKSKKFRPREWCQFCSTVWYNQLDLCCSIKNRQRNSTTKKRPIDVWEATNFRRLRPLRNAEVAENIKEKARQNVLKNKTIEFNVNDYVRVKLSQ